MTRGPALAIRRALTDLPFSLRALARAADLPHSSLVRIRQGTLEPSAAVTAQLLTGLDRLGTHCQALAARIRASQGS